VIIQEGFDLKKIFVLGDSISIHYGPYLKQYTEGVFMYDRKRGDEALEDLDKPVGGNGGDSRRIVEYLSQYIHMVDADVLLLNCGLHDLRRDRETQKQHINIPEYEENLYKSIELINKTKNKPVWVSTTPVDGKLHTEKKPFDRFNDDVIMFNKSAEKIMKENNIDIIDLYTFTSKINIGEPLSKDGVHFIEQVRALQGAFIAGWLYRYL